MREEIGAGEVRRGDWERRAQGPEAERVDADCDEGGVGEGGGVEAGEVWLVGGVEGGYVCGHVVVVVVHDVVCGGCIVMLGMRMRLRVGHGDGVDT